MALFCVLIWVLVKIHKHIVLKQVSIWQEHRLTFPLACRWPLPLTRGYHIPPPRNAPSLTAQAHHCHGPVTGATLHAGHTTVSGIPRQHGLMEGMDETCHYVGSITQALDPQPTHYHWALVLLS